jgi:hypothetical protein
MPRRKQTKAECYAKYRAFQEEYEGDLYDAEANLAYWQAHPESPRSPTGIWRTHALKARYERALAKLAARRAKACDWRE